MQPDQSLTHDRPNGLSTIQPGEQIFEEHLAILDDSAATLATRAEVDIQISTAKRYRRSVSAFKAEALDMATLDEETAAGCIYALPRGGKPIEGPSVRLAEIVASAWGNLRTEARVIGTDDKEITAEATTWDLEKNVAMRIQVRRRITDKYGRRFKDDMITVTGNAAVSIALRNSIFRVIPKAYVNAIYRAARQVAIGDASTLAAKRAEAILYFGKMGVTDGQIFAVLGKGSVDDIGLDDLAILKGMATAIKDGDISVDEAFAVNTSEPKGPVGVAGLKDRLNKPEEAEKSDEVPAVKVESTPEAETTNEPAATEDASDTTPKLSKTESQRLDQIEWIKTFEGETVENAEAVARILEDKDLNAMSAGQVKEVYLTLSK